MAQFLEALQPGWTILAMAHAFVSAGQRNYLPSRNGERIVVGVIDTNILLSDIRHDLQRAKPMTFFMEALRFGGVKLFASTTVQNEVWGKLNTEEITTQLQIVLDEAQQRWVKTYLPWSTFLHPTDLASLSAWVQYPQIKDLDDVPTGQIIKLIRPDVVLHDDKQHVGSFDIIAVDWFAAVLTFCATSLREAVKVRIQVGKVVAMQSTYVVAQCSSACLSTIDEEAWWRILLLLLIVLALAN